VSPQFSFLLQFFSAIFSSFFCRFSDQGFSFFFSPPSLHEVTTPGRTLSVFLAFLFPTSHISVHGGRRVAPLFFHTPKLLSFLFFSRFLTGFLLFSVFVHGNLNLFFLFPLSARPLFYHLFSGIFLTGHTLLAPVSNVGLTRPSFCPIHPCGRFSSFIFFCDLLFRV